MIRVLHVVGAMSQGGTENFIMNIYRNIDRDKIQFDFLVNRDGVFDNEIKKLGGKIYKIPALQKVGQIKYTKNLDTFFSEHVQTYKIVHSHINQVSGLILERANKAGIPIRIAHIHNNKYGKNIFVNLYKKYLGTKIKKNANYKFACSREAGEFLFGKDSDFKVINNSIEMKKYIYDKNVRNSKRNDLKIDENCFLIGSVGRLVYQKNPIFLLKVFYEFNKLENNSKLLLIGKGPLKEKITSFISENGLENKVILLEDRNDVNELMQAMDYFVLPSRYEGLGIVLIEAQSAGLKCITSKNVVSKEAKITDLLDFYSLKNKPAQWARFIYDNKNYTRKNMYEEVMQSGFDIKSNIRKIEEFYIYCTNNIGQNKERIN